MEKRKRASSIVVPTLIYSAPGHKRFAKLFTEQSLDQVKEVVQKRLNLTSSHFTLSYNTDIALENDDDFDAFAVYAEMTSPHIDVLIELQAQPFVDQAPPPAADNSISVIVDKTVADPGPPLKKRKLATAAATSDTQPDAVPKPKSTKPVSSATKPKKLKISDATEAPVAGPSKSNPETAEKTVKDPVAAEPKTKGAKKKSQAHATTLAPTAATEPDSTGPKQRKTKTPAPDVAAGATEKTKKTKKKSEPETAASAPQPTKKAKKSAEASKEKGSVKGNLAGAESAYLSFQEQLAHKITASSEKSKASSKEKAKKSQEKSKDKVAEPTAAHRAAAEKMDVIVENASSSATAKPKSKTSGGPNNVNLHSVPRRETGGVSDASIGIPDRALVTGDEDSESSESESPTVRAPKPIPPPLGTNTDTELDAIMRGPALSLDDLMPEEDDEQDRADSVVLEQDNQDDVQFRRRSRRLYADVPSSDDEDGVDENSLDPQSALPDSQPSSLRSATAPLMAIHSRRSMEIDSSGDFAVDQAMASDSVMFGLGNPLSASQPTVDDPILPAEDFAATPFLGSDHSLPHAQPSSSPATATQSKQRNGKVHVKLSQLELPISISPKPTPAAGTDDADEMQEAVEQTIPPKATRKRSAAAFTVNVDTVDERPPPKRVLRQRTVESSEVPAVVVEEPPPPKPKRARGPNKTPEQKAQEAAAKAAAKEEKERVKKEKALAKVTTVKKGPKNVTKKQDASALADPASDKAEASQHEWTVLNPASSYDEGDILAGSMRDELRSSSEAVHPQGSPFHGLDHSEDDENSEAEIAKMVKSSSKSLSTSSYRRLTDIASQPSLFSTPTLHAAPGVPSTFPRATRKDLLYGDASSDSSAGEEISHIPKARRAGAARK
ncbi:hypothetical protein C8F01DRAFT_1102924 [Mycena amicta]|nr:hypothetical protein C8F01DRAFT_1102924 [Mycena amicta]